MTGHGLLNFYGLIADHKVAGWQPIRIQHLRSLPLIAQSAVEKTATLWSVINPEQFSNSCFNQAKISGLTNHSHRINAEIS